MDGFEGIYKELPIGWFMSSGGKPARVLGPKGFPSFEHEDGELLVFDLLICQAGHDGTLRFFPRWYGVACVLATDDMVPLHHSPDAWWQWRPCVYNKGALDGWEQMSSQQELAWRHGLAEVMHWMHGGGRDAGDPMPFAATEDADARAEEVLRECLNPQQRLELASLGKFRVVGGKTENVYEIEPGNGFGIVDAVTGEMCVSYCLHPEEWIPHDDVALATKFALEDPELEVECLENARQIVLRPEQRRTPALWQAFRVERDMDLIAS